MKEFKCKNCGSSKYIQIKEDKYKCFYCDSEFDIVSAEKDAFEINLLGRQYKNNIKVLRTNVTEDEFYKNVLIQLSMNKNSPAGILDECKFDFVKYRYIYFAVCDIEYYEIDQTNVYGVDSQSANLAFSQDSNCVAKVRQNILITKDCFTEQSNIALKVFEKNLIQNFSMSNIKELKIKTPDKKEVETAIKNASNHLKDKIKREHNSRELTSKIINVEIYAIPEYSIEYKYKNEKYCLYSYAHELNIMGSLPNKKDYTIKENKKLMPVNIILGALCILMSAFSLLHVWFFKFFRFYILDLILFVLSIVMLALNLTISRVMILKLKKKVLKEKKESLLKYISKNNIKLNLNDEECINSFLRRY